jgi:hypothetical protein
MLFLRIFSQSSWYSVGLRVRRPGSIHYKENIVTCISIAKQRLGKHIPAKRTRSKEGCPLLGNGPVNTPL